jgi:hypothetical protein
LVGLVGLVGVGFSCPVFAMGEMGFGLFGVLFLGGKRNPKKGFYFT